MYSHEIKTRVRYADTDKMGYLQHGHYPAYYEIGRTEALRNLGISYKDVEESGIIMPIIDLNLKYIKPAYYDTLLTIKTYVKELPSVRITFFYEAFNEEKILINTCKTTLIFFDNKRQKPCVAPDNIFAKLEPFFT